MGRPKDTIRKNNEIVKKIYRSYQFRVRRDDEEILNKLNSVESINGYITDLIRQDLKNHK